MDEVRKAIVIGSGVAGLAASIRLAHAGFQTHVFEANAFPGGKINSKSIGGYRFDRGPSIFTAPEYLQELYTLCGEDFATFEMLHPTRSFEYFYNDGTRLSLSNDREQVIREITSKLGESDKTVRNYLDKAARNYTAISPLFIEQSLHRWRKLFRKALIKALLRLPQYRLNLTMDDENSKAFRNQKTVQFFNRFATYNGSSPYKAPAMLNMIGHLELNIAPPLPKNGMVQITDELVRLAKKKGVQFHLSTPVIAIDCENGRVSGIRTANETIKSDVVFSNMDVSLTYERLLPEAPRPEKSLRQERSSSALVFYWGVRRSFPELALHNVFFSDQYVREFSGLFEEKVLHEDPTLYINITSKHIPADAPHGCENWFVMLNAPTVAGQDWDAMIASARTSTLNKLSNILGCDLASLIEVEEIMDPRTIAERYSGKDGAIYGNASNNRFAAFNRHPNFSRAIKGLYFVGVSVHPGGGIPLALNSAKIAVEALLDGK